MTDQLTPASAALLNKPETVSFKVMIQPSDVEFCVGRGQVERCYPIVLVDSTTDLDEPFTGACVETGEIIRFDRPWELDIFNADEEMDWIIYDPRNDTLEELTSGSDSEARPELPINQIRKGRVTP